MTLHVLGMGSYHPPTIVTNQFLEDLGTGTSAQWILEKIGIEERRTVLPLEYIRETRNQHPEQALQHASIHPIEMGVKAAEQAIARAGVRPEQIGMVVCNACTPEFTVPSQADFIAKQLGINAVGSDVFTACPVFALHIDYLANYETEALPEYVLCVSTAALTLRVDYNDRTDGAIWGDGAAAWIISGKHPGKLRVDDSFYMTDPTRSQAVIVETFGYFWQDGRAVRDFSVRQTVRLIKRLEETHPIDWSKDIFIGHQANKTMLDQITNNRKIPEQNHWYNVTKIGNQAGAGAPATIAGHWDQITPGQKIVVAVVGAGLSWGSVLLEAT